MFNVPIARMSLDFVGMCNGVLLKLISKVVNCFDMGAKSYIIIPNTYLTIFIII